MNLRKITGRTLGEARNHASELYGSRYVVVETNEGTQSSPASITVYVESGRAEGNGIARTGIAEKSFAGGSSRAGYSAGVTTTRTAGSEAVNPGQTVVKPFWEQVGQLFESGSKTLSSLKNMTAPHPSPDTHSGASIRGSGTSSGLSTPPTAAPAEETGKEIMGRENTGVTYERSRPAIKPEGKTNGTGAGMQETRPEAGSGKTVDPAAFRNHFRRKPEPEPRLQAEPQVRDLARRIEQMEKHLYSLSDEDSPFSRDPFWRFLRKQNFTPDLLSQWFGPAADPSVYGQAHHQQVLSHIAEWFDSSDPLSASNKHLFTSFPGVNISQLVLSLAGHCRNAGLDFEVGIIYSNEYESDILGFQLLDSLKPLNRECHDIVTHRDWRDLTDRTDNNTLIFLLTLPMPFDIRGVSAALNHLNGIFGEYHFVRHHLVSHSLHNPAEILARIPTGHTLKPDYITLSNLEMARSRLGKMAGYKDPGGCEFGFFHTGEPGDEPFGSVDGSVSSFLAGEYERYLLEEKSASARSHSSHPFRNILPSNINIHPNHN